MSQVTRRRVEQCTDCGTTIIGYVVGQECPGCGSVVIQA